MVVSFSMSGSSVSLPAAVISSDSKEALDISMSKGCSRIESKSMVDIILKYGTCGGEQEGAFRGM